MTGKIQPGSSHSQGCIVGDMTQSEASAANGCGLSRTLIALWLVRRTKEHAAGTASFLVRCSGSRNWLWEPVLAI